MDFTNTVTLQGVVKTKPLISKNKQGETVLRFAFNTDISRNEKGICTPHKTQHNIEFKSIYPTTSEYIKKGHKIIITGVIDVIKNSTNIIRATSINWELKQLVSVYPEVEESFESSIDGFNN